jgi:diguanylate cyclase (GGDEF)-like protein/putative nucleotidyltransferase with HDIG domain
MRRLPGGIAAALLLAIWAHALTGFGGTQAEDFFARWMHDGVILASAMACLAAATSRDACRLAWGALGAGLVSMAVGDFIYSLQPDLGNVPVPSASDPFWLALYPCQYVALIALTRRRVGRTLWATRLDGLIGGLAIAAMLACVTVSAAVDGSAGAPFWEAATNLAYPVGDLILLAAIVSAVGLGGWRIDRLWATLGAAILALEAADLLYMTGALENGADAIMATGMVGIAWAATLAPGGGAARPVRTARGMFVPVVFGATALAVLALGVPLHFNGVALGLAVTALGLTLVRMTLALRENGALLVASHLEATTDALTGLSNRRKLQLDLAAVLEAGGPHVLVLLDLNGFKAYNDDYGHGVGDMLLKQLGLSLADAVDGVGEAYRMGGDEFCVLAPRDGDLAEFSAYCAAALAARGDGFEITAAHGAVLIPDEGRDASTVLARADARMYQHKNAGRPPAAHQSVDVLLAVMCERAPGLAAHVHAVCELAGAAAEELGVTGADLDLVRHAATLHDIGKMAIPDSILDKPGPLSDDEWTLIRRHTLIGERIMGAAPALQHSARLVRSSHERIDGTGYPDGLSGDAIPLGSRIILVADAFDAMVSERPYGVRRSVAEAIAELRRCAGSQFDPRVVDAFERVIARRPQVAVAAATA